MQIGDLTVDSFFQISIHYIIRFGKANRAGIRLGLEVVSRLIHRVQDIMKLYTCNDITKKMKP